MSGAHDVEHASCEPVGLRPGTLPTAVSAAVEPTPTRAGIGRLDPASMRSLQRSAGNRAAVRQMSERAARALQRTRRRRDPSDTVGTYMDDDDWSRAAWALGQLTDGDIRTRITAMTARERQLVIQGARFSEPQAWVETIVTAMMDIDRRSALVGSLMWARWKHEWARAHNWFHGLSLDDGRAVARTLDFKHDQLVQVIGDSEYLRLMFPDPWAFVSRAERMLRAMELLVDTHGYPVNGAAGIVGNLMGESGLIPSRVEGSAEGRPMTAKDAHATATDFTVEQVRDRDHAARTGPDLPGVGIAQWTSPSRRTGFFARPEGTGIMFDMAAQVSYLVDELNANFVGLNGRLRSATVTVADAADDVLEHFEAPRDPEQSRGARRTFATTAATTYRSAHPAPAVSTTPATPPATTTPATLTPAPTGTLSPLRRTLARQTAPAGAGLPHPGQQPDHRNAFDAFVAACVATSSVADLRAARTAVDLGVISSERLLSHRDKQLWVDQENLTAVMTRIRWRAMDLVNEAYLAGVASEVAETDEGKRREARDGILTKTRDWIAFLRDDPIKDPSSDVNRFEHWYAAVQGNVVSVLGLVAVASSLAAMPGQFPTAGAASSARQQTYDETGLPQFDKSKAAKADGSYPLTEWCGSFADMMRTHSGLNQYLAGRTQGTWGYWGVFNYTVSTRQGFPPVFAWDGQDWVSVEALHTARHARRLHWDFVNVKQDPFSLDLRPGDIVLIDNGANPPNHVTSVLAYHKDPAGGHAWLSTIGGNEASMITDTTHAPATDLEKTAGTGLKDPTKVTPDNPTPNFSHVGVSVRDLTLEAPSHDRKGAAIPGRAGVRYNDSRVWGIGRFSVIDYENHRYAVQSTAPTAPPAGFGP